MDARDQILDSFESGVLSNRSVTRIEVHALPSDIDLYRVSLDQFTSLTSRLLEWLSPGEQSFAQRFHFEADRVRFIAGRAVLRWLLGRRIRCDPASLELNYGPMGKPLLALGAPSSVRFNLSHSGGLAVYALSKYWEVGVDVERIRPVPEAESILRSHFAPEVIEQWLAIPPRQQPTAFFQSWVRREAIAKREGCGLVGLEESRERLAAAGSVIQFIPAPGYLGALAWRDAENPG